MRSLGFILCGLIVPLRLASAEPEPLNVEPALDELIQRASKGDVLCQFTLAGLYEERQSLTNAFRWYREAAELGYPRGQFKTGYYLATGQGGARDHAKAVEWFERAAEQGVIEAQYNLGVSYEKGLGTKQDHLEAMKWYRRAAEQGDSHAQKAVGVFYERGLAVAKDVVEAFKWYSLAATSGNEQAKALRDLIQKGLTLEQLADGKSRAAAYKPVAEAGSVDQAKSGKAKPKDFLD
jgi:uncharacterized protein